MKNVTLMSNIVYEAMLQKDDIFKYFNKNASSSRYTCSSTILLRN